MHKSCLSRGVLHSTHLRSYKHDSLCIPRSLIHPRITNNGLALTHARFFSNGSSSNGSAHDSPRVAIIGSGPAGFYTVRHLSRHLHPKIDMYERLPVPYGLVRFGVAPDHPEVKNCTDEFAALASSGRTSSGSLSTGSSDSLKLDSLQSPFRFIGNIALGKDLPLSLLKKHYDVIVFAYGASQDRELGLATEHDGDVYSARAFVGWYNGLPEYRDLDPQLSKHVVVVGQGNVALDCARILLSDIEKLSKTDITSHAIEVLRKSDVQKVTVVGRRGPVQASFTIKEVRELMNMVGVRVDKSLIPDPKSLPRAKRRLMELLNKAEPKTGKELRLEFCLRPVEILRDGVLSGMRFRKTKLDDLSDPNSSVSDDEGMVDVECGTVMRSIGYRAEAIPGMQELAEFDEKKAVVKHDGVGRVSVSQPSVYCAGWVKRGPTGVIASTMTDAFETAEAIVADWKGGSVKDGWIGVKADAEKEGYDLNQVVEWTGWEKIDQLERQMGQKKDKPREKLTAINEMIKAAGVV